MSCSKNTPRPSYLDRLFVVVAFSRTWGDLARAPFRAL
jgi:hypothetical protein